MRDPCDWISNFWLVSKFVWRGVGSGGNSVNLCVLHPPSEAKAAE